MWHYTYIACLVLKKCGGKCPWPIKDAILAVVRRDRGKAQRTSVLWIQFVPVFPGKVPIFWVLKICVRVSIHIRCGGAGCHKVLQVTKIRYSWKCLIIGTGEVESEMCRSVSVECGVRLRRVRNGYTECPGGNVPDFGRMFLTLKYTDITQNTYIRSWTVTEIMAREFWKYDSCYTLIDYQIHIKTGRNM